MALTSSGGGMNADRMSHLWRCGCLVRDPVTETLHWALQPSWVDSCENCDLLAPWLLGPIQPRRGYDWPQASS